jgi:hypothetical protein
VPITFTCPSCGKSLEFGNEAAGNLAKCPLCKAGVLVPSSLINLRSGPAVFFGIATLVALLMGAAFGVDTGSTRGFFAGFFGTLSLAWVGWTTYLTFKFNRCMDVFLTRKRDDD